MADAKSDPDAEPVESLRVTQAEAREVLDQQSELIGELHEKAVHTLRLNVLLLGVVLTLASVLAGNATTPGVGQMATGFVVAGVVASVVSMGTAVWSYSSTSLRLGTNSSDLRAFLRRRPPEDEWLPALLYNYATWIEQNESTETVNLHCSSATSSFLRRWGTTLAVSSLECTSDEATGGSHRYRSPYSVLLSESS